MRPVRFCEDLSAAIGLASLSIAIFATVLRRLLRGRRRAS
jgi:hypothetical protein